MLWFLFLICFKIVPLIFLAVLRKDIKIQILSILSFGADFYELLINKIGFQKIHKMGGYNTQAL